MKIRKMKLLLIFLILIIPVLAVADQPAYLLFDGYSLKLCNKQGALIKQWKAGAGSIFSTVKDQSQKNRGPLPEGTYIVRRDHTIFFNHDDSKSKLKWFLKYIAWGDLAIPLEPHATNKMYGRNAFMIHGGGWIVGSKGCVYVYSKSTEVYQALKQCSGNVELMVKY